MTNITLDGLPAKTGTISDSGIIHYREGGVDKKMTVADFLIRISEEYSTDINTFLGAADKAAGRAALGIARRTAVSNADYTILVTDKVIAQTGTMSAARTFSLPSAASFPAGEELIIIDQSGTVTPTNKIIVTRNGSNTIDGATSKDITAAYGFLRLICNGVDSWKIVNADPIVSATTSVPGIVELLTNAELATGTDTTRAATAAAIASAVLGFNQSWQDVTGSRALSTTYTNSTGRPIEVKVTVSLGNTNTFTNLIVGGINASRVVGPGAGTYTYEMSAIVPNGISYSVSGGSPTLSSWRELR